MLGHQQPEAQEIARNLIGQGLANLAFEAGRIGLDLFSANLKWLPVTIINFCKCFAIMSIFLFQPSRHQSVSCGLVGKEKCDLRELIIVTGPQKQLALYNLGPVFLGSRAARPPCW